ncbi:unnamed protein product [Amoebophrya sp. A25]|nr:unnamed protein product [Amoebophrya sp. A25]|eukprot:GSA25T00019623001.1
MSAKTHGATSTIVGSVAARVRFSPAGIYLPKAPFRRPERTLESCDHGTSFAGSTRNDDTAKRRIVQEEDEGAEPFFTSSSSSSSSRSTSKLSILDLLGELSPSLERGVRYDRIRLGPPILVRRTDETGPDCTTRTSSRASSGFGGYDAASNTRGSYSGSSSDAPPAIRIAGKPRWRRQLEKLHNYPTEVSSSSGNAEVPGSESDTRFSSTSSASSSSTSSSSWSTGAANVAPPRISQLAEDRVAVTSLRSVQLLPSIRERISRLLQDFGNKRDLQRHGRYIQDIMRSRSSAEIPARLASRFLPEFDDGESPMDRIVKDPAYQAAIRGQEYKDLSSPSLAEEDENKIDNLDEDHVEASTRSDSDDHSHSATKRSKPNKYEDIFADEDENNDEETSTSDDEMDGNKSSGVRPPKTMAYLTRLARAHADDSHHKLYQMFWSPEAALAYLGERYQGAYASNMRILHEVRLRCLGFNPKRVLDYGSGPAPSVAAALRIFDTVEEVVLVEPSAHMVQLGQHILKDYTSGPQFQHYFDARKLQDEEEQDFLETGVDEQELSPEEEEAEVARTLDDEDGFRVASGAGLAGDHEGSIGTRGDESSDADPLAQPSRSSYSNPYSGTSKRRPLRVPPKLQWQSCLYDERTTGVAPERRFDLITLSYVQMDIKGQPSRDMLIRNLWNRLAPGGVLMLVERGTPTGFRFMHHTREMFIEEMGTQHFHFVAPCPHESMCPLAVTGRDWCHFSQRVGRLSPKVYCKGSRAKNMENEKFSFLAIRRGPGPRVRYASEKQCPTAEEKSYFWPRVVFPSIKRGGHVLMDVCSRCTKGCTSISSSSSGTGTDDHSKSAGCGSVSGRSGSTAKDTSATTSSTSAFGSTTSSSSSGNKEVVESSRFERISTSKAKAHLFGFRFSRQCMWGDLWRYPKRVNRAEARAYITDDTRQHLDRLAKKAIQAMGLDADDDCLAAEARKKKSSDETNDDEARAYAKATQTHKNHTKRNDTSPASNSNANHSSSAKKVSTVAGQPSFWREKRNSEYHYGK